MSKTEEMAPPVPARDAADPPRIDERYRIEKEIGRGGMGRVFVAHDRKLGRDVAIKVLASALRDEESLRRFEQEARATCALNHANILDVHDIGTYEGSPYIVSELLRGITLRERLRRGPLPAQEATGYALQLAQGLSAAHEKGIVHRDLKPENLFITEEGRLKILDFGIAKLVAPMGSETGGTLPSPQPHTEDGAILGTVGYMSPEQVRGQPADQRSDVFSFGAIVYEMLAGRNAFERDTAVETGSAILNDDPPPLPGDVSATLRRLVQRCLAKRPEDRFQSARELVDVLAPAGVERAPAQRRIYRWALGGAAALILVALAVLGWRLVARGEGPGNSIAVLPFVNLSSDRENEYFSDGITEEIINALANVEGLRVVARTSAFSFKGKNVDLRQVGGVLGVGTVLEGSVRRDGGRLRVTAQLINVADGYHIWSKSFDRELKNVFTVEDELSRAIVEQLRPRLIGVKTLVQQATSSSEAHNLYLQGRFFWNQRTREGLAKAEGLFQQALALDPGYALAHSGLSDCYMSTIAYGGAPAAQNTSLAAAEALKAVELDGSLAEAHSSLAMVKEAAYDWAGAEREHQRALALKPGHMQGHQWYGRQLWVRGRFAEAQAEAERARQLDPSSFIVGHLIAALAFDQRDYRKAIEQARRTLELNPGFDLSRILLAEAYLQIGRLGEALAAIDGVNSPSAQLLAARAEVLAASGEKDAARALVEQVEQRMGAIPPAVALAGARLALGDREAALAWLEKALAQGDQLLLRLKVNPMWDPLRAEPRFRALLRRMNLE
jgi:serine/threonine-protein kinase